MWLVWLRRSRVAEGVEIGIPYSSVELDTGFFMILSELQYEYSATEFIRAAGERTLVQGHYLAA